MTQAEEATPDVPDAPAEERKTRRPRGRLIGWFFLRMIWGAVIVALVLAVLGFALTGRSFEAPEWVRERLEGQAALTIAGGDISFGGLDFVVLEGWKPRARLRDVRVTSASGAELAAFSRLETALSLDALLNGEIKAQSVLLEGAFATLRRGVDGSFSLSGGYDLSAPTQEAASLAALIEGLDTLLLTPRLSDLESADLQALTLRFEDESTGRAWTIDGGRLRMERQDETLTISGDLALLSGAADVATLELNYTSGVGSPEAEFGVRFSGVAAQDIAVQSPALAWLEALRAPISGSLRSGADAEGALSPLNAALTIGAGVLQPNEETRPVPFEAAQAYFSYDPEEQALRFDELSVKSAWATGQAEGTAWLEGLENGTLEDFVAQLRFSELSLNPLALFPAPVEIAQADTDLRLTLDPFRIELGQAALQLGERSVIMQGDLQATEEGWFASLDAQVDALTPAEVTGYWPESLAPKARSWIVENLLAADLRAVDVALRGVPDAPIASYLSFDFNEAEIRYLKTLPPLQRANGHASMLEDRFVVTVEKAVVEAPSGGMIDVGSSAFVIPDINDGDRPAEITLKTESSIEAALAMIDLPPLEIMTEAGLATDLAEGTASLEGEMKVLLKKGAEADFNVSGILANVKSDKLIEGRALASRLLLLEASREEVIIGGAGSLGGVPFEAAWRQEVGSAAPATVSGSLTLSDDTLQSFGVGLPRGTVQGAGVADVEITLNRDSPPDFRLSSGLAGVGLRIPALGWSMGRRATGTLQLAGRLGARPKVDRLVLEGPGLSARGSVTLAAGGGLSEARFERVRLANWLDAPVTLVGRGKGAAPEVRVRGGSIDLRRAELGSGEGGSAMPIALALNRLQITDTIALTDFRGNFAARSGLDGSFTARINGGPAVEGRVVPQRGRTAVQIRSNDAGSVVSAAGLLRQAVGGELSLTLTPVGREGTFDGFLKISQTRVKKAPVMADMLSALSIVGLLEQLSGNGILFSDVDATFRMTPQQIILQRASAVGPSLGISMDGIYGVAQKSLNMQGVVSPVYFLNGIGSLLTRRGEGLIGFSYRLKGTASTPKVTVNPLSGLTPGFFREIFRAPPPKVPDAE